MGLTGEEIGKLTPWEVEQRAKGYARRLKDKKAFTASFVTAPIINGGYRAPKHPITAERLVPEAFHHDVSPDKKKRVLEFAEEMERRRAHGKS